MTPERPRNLRTWKVRRARERMARLSELHDGRFRHTFPTMRFVRGLLAPRQSCPKFSGELSAVDGQTHSDEYRADPGDRPASQSGGARGKAAE